MSSFINFICAQYVKDFSKTGSEKAPYIQLLYSIYSYISHKCKLLHPLLPNAGQYWHNYFHVAACSWLYPNSAPSHRGLFIIDSHNNILNLNFNAICFPEFQLILNGAICFLNVHCLKKIIASLQYWTGRKHGLVSFSIQCRNCYVISMWIAYSRPYDVIKE